MRKIRKLVIPVAGQGTRVLPATKSIPKEMLPIVDRPLIDYVVHEALEAGIEHIVFVTGRGKGALEEYFDHAVELEASLEQGGASKQEALEDVRACVLAAGSTSFTRQQTPKGLGHAIWCARDIVGHEPFAIALPDVIVSGQTGCLKQLVDCYASVQTNVIAVERVPREEVSKYGVIDPKGAITDRLIEMRAMVEKPDVAQAPSNLMIMGRYVLQPEIFDILATTTHGAGNEIQLTDAMNSLLKVQPFFGYQFEGQSHDCGSKIGWMKANLAFAAQRDAFAHELAAYAAEVFQGQKT